MKAKIFFLTICIFLKFSLPLLAQSINCSDFSVLAISPDTLNSNGYLVRVHFNADSNSFVNYPHVLAVLDCNGDTVATGGMFFFGQLGQTSADYPITVSGSLDCEPLSLVFVYGDDNLTYHTCLLSFGTSTGLSNEFQKIDAFSIFPNPSKDHLNIQSTINQIGVSFYVYDGTGRLMLSRKLISENTLVDMSNLSKGMYFFILGDDMRQTYKVIKE